MFDRYNFRESPGRISVDVTEKRAPTDESVRLLREMEKAAQDKIIASIRIENSPIDCVVHMQENIISGMRDYLVLAKINGHRIEVRESLRPEMDVNDVARKLVDELAKMIAVHLLITPFGKAMQGLPVRRR